MKAKKVYIVEWKSELQSDFEIYENVNDANERRKQLSNDTWFDSVWMFTRELKPSVPKRVWKCQK